MTKFVVHKKEKNLEVNCAVCPRRGDCYGFYDCRQMLLERLYEYERLGYTPNELSRMIANR